MPLFLNDTSFVIDGSRTTLVSSSPATVTTVYTGMIVRVFNTGPSSQTYTYTNTSFVETDVAVPASGSVGNPLYVLAASSSAADSFNAISGIAAIRLFITGSTLGNSFTEELITVAGAGTWTKPVGVTEVIVECWGGGGAGGGCTDTLSGGGGGAGGQYIRDLELYSSTSTTVNYTVADSVAGTTGNGANGNNTIWGANQIVALGGQGGEAGVNLFAALGGTGSLEISQGGKVVNKGGNGNFGSYIARGDTAAGGSGGGGAGSSESLIGANNIGGFEYGGNGQSGGQVVGSSGQNGLPGSNYAAGGSGAAKISGAGRSGGDGAQGLIRLIYR